MYEVFIAYGHEEFFECKDPLTRSELNFGSLLDTKYRRMARMTDESKQSSVREDQYGLDFLEIHKEVSDQRHDQSMFEASTQDAGMTMLQGN